MLSEVKGAVPAVFVGQWKGSAGLLWPGPSNPEWRLNGARRQVRRVPPSGEVMKAGVRGGWGVEGLG